MGLVYKPKQKDICYINFNPTKGHEQSGLRPVVIISNDDFIKLTGMIIICPITTNTKKFPTHYELLFTKKIKGSVLCEHIRSIDYNVQKLTFVEKIDNKDFTNIINIVKCLID